ncbi:MAG: hypothetical protein EPO42_13330 [Gallionellaceae bacterium]|nr:MAG: hypothetical protein EPO42_13330 [Gallionellaceae bacterium]
MTTINRLTANLRISTIAAVADRAAESCISFDAALEEIIERGLRPEISDELSEACAQLVGACDALPDDALAGHAGRVWQLINAGLPVAESEGGHAD